jgi:sister-chromatid-cohesion protein PDS5
MFGERPVVGTGVADIPRAFPSTWRAWLGRKVDKNVGVRLAWVEAAKGILVNHPELGKEVEGKFNRAVSLTLVADLVDRIHDSDEKVRAAICKIVGTLDYESALLHVSTATLKAVGGRVSDKKVSSDLRFVGS